MKRSAKKNIWNEWKENERPLRKIASYTAS